MADAEKPVAMPPAPPGETSRQAVQKTRAVVDAIAQLGDDADPVRVAQTIRQQTGVDIAAGEVAEIMRELKSRATTPAEKEG